MPRSAIATTRRRGARRARATSACRASSARPSRSAAAAAASRAREEEFERDRRARPRGLADRPGAARPVGARLGRVRARGHARPQRQRRDRLLDRERRPDGRAHRRQRHRRAAADAHRPPLPAAARPGDRRHPRRRRRDRRLQRPVRRQPGDRGDPRHRDEPARLALERAGLEGDRLPDRQDRRAAGRRLRAGGDPQRHHPDHAGELRADDRLRRRQVAALRLREVPRRRPGPVDAHEVGRRGDGDRAHVPAGVRQGAAQPRARHRHQARRASTRRRCWRCSSARPADRYDVAARGLPHAARASTTSTSARAIDPWFLRELRALALDPDGAVRRRALLQGGRHLRGRVPGAHAVLLLGLGAPRRPRGRARRAPERRHPRQRAQPHRPGHRVRLLLRARRDDRPRVRAATR